MRSSGSGSVGRSANGRSGGGQGSGGGADVPDDGRPTQVPTPGQLLLLNAASPMMESMESMDHFLEKFVEVSGSKGGYEYIKRTNGKSLSLWSEPISLVRCLAGNSGRRALLMGGQVTFGFEELRCMLAQTMMLLYPFYLFHPV
jgi:hypothetical protein